MAKMQRFLQRFQLKRQRTSPLIKVAVAAAIMLSTVTLVSMCLCQMENQQRLNTLYSQASQLEQENADLTDRINNSGTVDSIRQIAEEELDMVDPESIIIEED